MFGFGSAFKPRSHYVFDYTPRYYNERKERIEKLKEKYKNEEENPHDNVGDKDDEDDITITFQKSNLKSAWKKAKKTPGNSSSIRRLAIIIAILVGIVAYLFELHKLI